MFISHTYKLIFFEVPRTGSRSISKALAQLDPHSPTAIVRAEKQNLYHYHVFDEKLLEQHPDYALIAVHRNPYERIRSHFKYRKQYSYSDELKQLSFPDYIKWVCKEDLCVEIGHFMVDYPISELLPCEQVDHFLRFDQLNDDWEILGKELNIKLPELPFINNSSVSFNQESVYTEKLASHIATRFAEDFNYFGYPINSYLDL